MAVRTDLALELRESLPYSAEGVEESTETDGDIRLTRIKITSEEGERAIGRQKGNYITLEFPSILQISDYSALKNAVIRELRQLVGEKEKILVAGLGNTDITPDAVGPLTARQILATRHITGQFAESIGLKGLKSVSVISPGVLGQTGIETTELINGAVSTVKPDAVIVIDALAAASTERLFKTVQLSDTGISPGSGVKNSRKQINEKNLGVPVIAVGVPTVMDAEALAAELTGKESEKSIDMFVTPKEVDLLCDRISEILANALNIFLQPEIDADIIAQLV
ncbi:MAG: GPR endopeptidase [Acutalibacteraceae bacterium]